MTEEERLSVRLSSDDFSLLSELVLQGKYSSEAEIVRIAVNQLLSKEFTPEEKESALLKIRQKKTFSLNDFISDGEDASVILGNVIDRGLESNRE